MYGDIGSQAELELHIKHYYCTHHNKGVKGITHKPYIPEQSYRWIERLQTRFEKITLATQRK